MLKKNPASESDHELLSPGPESKPRLSPLAAAIRISVLGLGLAHGVSQAATIAVDTDVDNGAGCTLREAIESMNLAADTAGCVSTGDAFGTNDIINFDAGSLASNLITLTGSELSLTATTPLTIDASGVQDGVTIDANQLSRVMNVGNGAMLTIDSMTITGGSAVNGGGISANNAELVLNNSSVSANNATQKGGGIYLYEGSVELNESSVSNNVAALEGGGIYGTYNNYLTLVDSTVSGNTATIGNGGGINCYDDCTATLTSSTVSGNSAGDAGGGIYTESNSDLSASNTTISGNHSTAYGGGLYVGTGVVNLNNTTIAANTEQSSLAGGMVVSGATVTLTNSIIANNVANDNPGGDCFISLGTVTPDAASIIEDGNCNALRSGDPALANLGDNGGPTQTHVLRSGSIARNAGNPVTCEINDQRGIVRDDGDGACDVGSVEYISSDDQSTIFVIPLGNSRVVIVPL